MARRRRPSVDKTLEKVHRKPLRHIELNSYDPALVSSKLAEAKGLLLEYKASESIGSGTATVFSELAKYMSEPYTDRYLHEYVDYILKKISTRIE